MQIAVIGLGRFGFHLACELQENGHDVLAIDRADQPVQEIKDRVARAVCLDARDKERLEALGLADMDVVVVSLGEKIDASALVSLHLQDLGVEKLVVKAGSEDHAKLLERLEVWRIVFPEREAAGRLVRHLSDSNLLDFVSLGESYAIEELAAPDFTHGHTLAELDLRKRYDVLVIGVRDVLRDTVQMNPGADFQLKESDALVLLGRNEDFNRLRQDS